MTVSGVRRYSMIVAVPLVALLTSCSGSETTPGATPTQTGSGVPSATTSISAAQISAGGYHTCAIALDGTISCWGLGDYGQLGNGSVEASGGTTPIDAPEGVAFTKVAAGNAHTCAIDTEGSVWCWGVDGDGTHEGENAESHGPQLVALPEGLRIVTLDGYYHSCATDEDGGAWCWGRGEEGQLGDGSITDTLEPVHVAARYGVEFSQVATEAFSTCALTSEGAIWCWGMGPDGRVDGSASDVEMKIPGRLRTPAGIAFSAIAAGFSHTCALTTEGAAWCWGEGTEGQLGGGTTRQRSKPRAVDTPEGVVFSAIDAGNAHTCALATDGSVWCWGLGVQGGASDGSTSSLIPTEVQKPTEAAALAISAGGFHSCALLDDGTAWCWGDDSSGQLGDGAWNA